MFSSSRSFSWAKKVIRTVKSPVQDQRGPQDETSLIVLPASPENLGDTLEERGLPPGLGDLKQHLTVCQYKLLTQLLERSNLVST